MAAVPTLIASGTIAGASGDTGAQTWTGDRTVIVCTAAESGGGFPTSVVPSGGGVTWTLKATETYRSRRRISIYRSSGTPTGAVDIDGTPSAGSIAEIQWHAVAIANFDSDEDGANDNSIGGATSLNLPDLGTLGANDIAIFGASMEQGSDNLSVATGSTELGIIEGGSDVRSTIVGYSSTDETPGVTWNTSGDNEECGIVGFIIYGTAAATGAARPLVNNIPLASLVGGGLVS